MSVLVAISRIKLEKNPINKTILNVYTPNEEISSRESQPCLEPSINISFLLSKLVKNITLVIQEHISEGKWHIIGKANFYLYNVDEIREGETQVKLINLKKVTQSNEKNDLAKIAGSLVLEISRSSKRKILSEIEEIQFTVVQDEVKEQVNDVREAQIYEEVTITPSEKQVNKEENVEPKHQTPIYEIDQEGVVTLKPLKHQVQLFQVLQQLNKSSIPPKEEKLQLSAEQIKEYSSLDPAKLKESAVVKHIRMKQPSKKPQIFQSPPQKDHIDLNVGSNMFQVYNMCCGQEIDRSHEIQQSY